MLISDTSILPKIVVLYNPHFHSFLLSSYPLRKPGCNNTYFAKLLSCYLYSRECVKPIAKKKSNKFNRIFTNRKNIFCGRSTLQRNNSSDAWTKKVLFSRAKSLSRHGTLPCFDFISEMCEQLKKKP